MRLLTLTACVGFAFAAYAREVVSWKTFAQVEMTRASNRMIPRFPETLAALDQKRPLAYTDNPVTVTGKLSVLKDDPTGIFYRLTDAIPTK